MAEWDELNVFLKGSNGRRTDDGCYTWNIENISRNLVDHKSIKIGINEIICPLQSIEWPIYVYLRVERKEIGKPKSPVEEDEEGFADATDETYNQIDEHFVGEIDKILNYTHIDGLVNDINEELQTANLAEYVEFSYQSNKVTMKQLQPKNFSLQINLELKYLFGFVDADVDYEGDVITKKQKIVSKTNPLLQKHVVVKSNVTEESLFGKSFSQILANFVANFDGYYLHYHPDNVEYHKLLSNNLTHINLCFETIDGTPIDFSIDEIEDNPLLDFVIHLKFRRSFFINF